jgi:regulator of cell morphogenesis and NO signaling
MFLKSYRIEPASFVTEIVTNDYRTAEVFRKYGIEYCCGGRWPLEMVCDTKGIDIAVLTKELEEATRTVQVPNSLPFNEWDIDFLADYIVHVHHHYLKKQLPEMKALLLKFADEHRKKYPYIPELENTFLRFYKEMLPHLQQEEEIIFPYIRQIAHAFDSREPYASLLVRTLRKPIEEVMNHEHTSVIMAAQNMRELTNDYTPPAQACVSHKVVFLKLKELDNDLMQHMHLENNILFPRAIEMEKILLSKTG